MLPSGEQMMGGGTARWADLLALARRAEELGFDSLWAVDHVQYQFGDTRDIGMWECWSLLAGLAAATTRIELGSLVTSTAYRNPVMLANIADTVDEISGGRVILGLGAGWVESEFRALGIPFDHRVDRFEEAIRIVTGLLREREVELHGSHYDASEAKLRPPGARPQGPPVMVGTAAHGPRMLSLTARYADIWNIAFRTAPGTLPAAVAAMDAACRAVGRDPASLRRFASLQVNVAGHGEPGDHWIADTRAGNALSGSPEELAATVRAYGDAGIEHVQVWLDPNTIAGIEALAPVLELLRSA
jgi:alkanesulfonate monooxygenase SsuD/methylene tetrahydromethanopterin reductase-like flavin-dependent oxidoreductase (luciferase family)